MTVYSSGWQRRFAAWRGSRAPIPQVVTHRELSNRVFASDRPRADRDEGGLTHMGLAADAKPSATIVRRRMWILTAAYLISVVIVIVGAIKSRYILGNIDGISYISIARQYAHGQWDTAVNAYWSPLISWLTAPLIGFGVPEILAFSLVSGIAGLVATGIGSWLVWRATRGHFWATGIFLFCSAVFTAGNLYNVTPDMLVVAWVFLFLSVLVFVSRRLPVASTKELILHAIILGATGALGYVTKLYLVPVFIATLATWIAVARLSHYRISVRKREIRSPLALGLLSLAVALLLSTPWIAALSVKYGELTAGSSFAVNIEAKFDPVGPGEGANALMLWAPPNPNAVSFGEDRSEQVEGPAFQSSASIMQRLGYYVSERIAAFPFYIQKIGSIAPWAVLILAGSGIAILWRKIRLRTSPLIMLGTIMAGVYFVGYAAITSAGSGGGNARYYWPLLPLSTLIACVALPRVWALVATSGRFWRRAIAALLMALIPLAVLGQHGVGKAAPFSTIAASNGLVYLIKQPVPSAAQQLAEGNLATIIPPGSKLVGSNYRATLTLAFYLNSQVFGRAQQGYDVTDSRFQDLLRKTGINYYLLFTPQGEEPIDLSALGPTVASFGSKSTCNDEKGAPVVDCQIDVIEVE
ncbi:MAG: hypothetical protein KF801_00465 [Cryobacterium sp.]|nr:hypothetical protein [Cryobacterium sp.]